MTQQKSILKNLGLLESVRDLVGTVRSLFDEGCFLAVLKNDGASYSLIPLT
jgi:hypothetical protein